MVWSEQNAIMIRTELSVSYGSLIEEQHIFETRKYGELAKQLEREGYHCSVKPIETGSQ